MFDITEHRVLTHSSFSPQNAEKNGAAQNAHTVMKDRTNPHNVSLQMLNMRLLMFGAHTMLDDCRRGTHTRCC
jgi:hypothetical protein